MPLSTTGGAAVELIGDPFMGHAAPVIATPVVSQDIGSASNRRSIESTGSFKTSEQRRICVRKSLAKFRVASKSKMTDLKTQLKTQKALLTRAMIWCQDLDGEFAIPDFVPVPLNPEYVRQSGPRMKRTPAATKEHKEERRREQNRKEQAKKAGRDANAKLNVEKELIHVTDNKIKCYAFLTKNSPYFDDSIQEVEFDDFFSLPDVENDEFGGLDIQESEMNVSVERAHEAVLSLCEAQPEDL